MDCARWVAKKIAKLGTNSPWVEGKGEIKKASLHFKIKFWSTVVKHHLSMMSVYQILTWDREMLISNFIDGYDIDFARWIQTAIHKRAFNEFTALPFPCLIE